MKARFFTPSTKKQNAMIGYLMSRLKMDDETKEDLIYNYSDGRTTHISQLNLDEAKRIIATLVDGSNLPQSTAEKQRRKILSMAHELGWELPGGNVDMKRVNNWCINYGGQGKALDGYTAHDLPALVTQFEHMYLKHLKGI